MARIIQIGKRQWLAGLTWSSFEDAPSKNDLQEDAQRLHASWAAVRITESAIQAGFCAPVESIKSPQKLYSLAAMLADSKEQPWLGIFKIEEGLWWYIAVRDGHAILPDGDVIGGKAEIHAARDRHAGYTDWKYIEGDINLLEEFINEIDAKPTPVRSLHGTNLPIIPLIILAVILACSSGGGYYWWQQKQQAEEQARLLAMQQARAQMQAGKPITAFILPSPLLTTPEPNEWLFACGNIISNLPLSQQGWELDKVGCNTTSAMVHWLRQNGATVANKPEGDLSSPGDEINQTIPLIVNTQGKDDAIALPDAKLIFRAWAQTAGFSLTLNEAAPPPPSLPGAEPTTAPIVMHPQANIILEIPISPFHIDLSKIPGLRLTSLQSTKQMWHIEGILYGRR